MSSDRHTTQGSHLREITIKPSKRGYVHRPIAVWCAETMMDEDGLSTNDPRDAVAMLANMDGPLIITRDPGSLLALVQEYGDLGESAPLQLVVRLSDVGPDEAGDPYISKARLTYVGWKLREGVKGRHRRLGMVIDPVRMVGNPKNVPDNTHKALMGLAWDIRDWCCENNIPLRSTGAGLANGLMRSNVVLPRGTGRVPTATNERLREFLPGTHYQDGPKTIKSLRYSSVTSFDQKRAYHNIARTTPMPDPLTLHARGFFQSQRKMWLTPGYHMDRVLSQPGMVLARIVMTRKPPHFAPPIAHAAWSDGHDVDGVDLPMWTVEYDSLVECGGRVMGIIAAWTSIKNNPFMPEYAERALSMIDEATPMRAKWLKPTLHAGYGMLGARPRTLRMGMTTDGPGGTWETWGLSGRAVRVRVIDLPKMPSPMTNVAALGVLQAAVRDRTLRLARYMQAEGMTVLRAHADALHVASEQVPLVMDGQWLPQKLTNVSYVDKQSWTSDQRRVMPGRASAKDGAQVLSNRLQAKARAAIMKEDHAHGVDNTHR